MYDELTEVDIKKMQEEINYRTRVLRPQLIEEVQTARAFGDLSENYEYKCAKQAKNRNDSRIRYLERMIDLLSIEWFLPAVNWAAETGVTGGTAEGAFAAARHLTWQEAAVFLVRTVEALGLEPEAVRTAPLPDALAEGAWDQTALELAWEWGLLPEDAGSAAEIARVQGGAMADAFAALL